MDTARAADARRISIAVVVAGPLLPLSLLPQDAAVSVSNAVRGLTLAVVLVLMVRAARTSEPAIVRSRWLFVSALAAAAAGSLISAGYAAATGTVPVPSVADVITPLWFVLAGYGFYCVPRRDGGRAGSPRIALDAVVSGSALFFVAWLLVLEPILSAHRGSTLSTVVQLMYPVGDAFTAALIFAVQPHARGDVRRLLDYVAAGMLLIAVSDAGAARLWAEHGKTVFGLPDFGLEAGLVLIAFGSVAKPQVLPARIRPPAVYLPFAPVLAALAIGLGYLAMGHSVTLAAVLPLAVMLAALLARQVLSARELTSVAAVHERAAMVDELTGLATRRAFLQRLREHVRTPGLPPAAVLLIDLDGFKEINDSFGHHTGDEALAEFGQLLSSRSRGRLVARLGGDEFAVACFGETAKAVARSIAAEITEVQHLRTSGEGPIALRCSVGIALTRSGDDGTSQVLRRADLAMYTAKTEPAQRFTIFEQGLEEAASRKHLLAAALSNAADRGQLHLVYQPLYDLANGRLAAAEALLRWTHPTFGSVSPAEFIPLAEETGQIIALGDWVLREAVQTVAGWRREGLHLPRLLINVAARQFTPQFADRVAQLIERHGVPAERLTLEVTETQLAGLEITDTLRELHQLGIRLALDDFGAGYSSLAQLARLPVDVLKIDRQFIADLDRQAGRDILQAIVNLASTLQMVTVAEGIETNEQLELATRCGVAYGQGFLLDRPLPAHQLASRLLQLPARLPRQRPPLRLVADAAGAVADSA